MKRLSLLASLLLALVALGCNGSNDSNGGGNFGGGAIPGLTPGLRVEAVAIDDPNQLIDPLNIEVNEQVQFQLVNYAADGTRTVVGGDQWSTDDVGRTYGSLASNSGIFTAADRVAPEPIGIAVSYQGNRYSTTYQVKARLVRLNGNIFVEGTGTPVYGVAIQFFDEQRLPVGFVRSQSDGSFRAIVPSRAVNFQIQSESVPGELFRSYLFTVEETDQEGNFTTVERRFDTGRADCRPTIQPLTNGIRFLLSDIQISPNTGGSAPDPTGCTAEEGA